MLWITGLLNCIAVVSAVPEQPFIHKLSPLQISGNTYAYHVVMHRNITWYGAKDLCRGATPAGYLALLNDDVSMTHIRNSLPMSEVRMWIGGQQAGHDVWTWLSGHQGQVLRGPVGADEQCGSLSVTGVYTSMRCPDTTGSYMCTLPQEACSRQTNSTCFVIISNATVCIAVCHSSSPTTWFEARNGCLRRSGDLVSLDDADLARDVIGQMEYKLGHTQQVMWVGLRRRPWIWMTDGDPQEMTYTYWGEGEPRFSMTTSMCIAVEARGELTTWLALSCDAQINAVLCQAPFSCCDNQNTTQESGEDDITICPETLWLDNRTSVVVLSVSAAIVVILLLVVASLVVCLRNAKRLNVHLGSGPKTYFDYFDFGFRRLMPNNQQDTQKTRTMVLTDDMLKSPGAHGDPQRQKPNQGQGRFGTGLDQDFILVGKNGGSSLS